MTILQQSLVASSKQYHENQINIAITYLSLLFHLPPSILLLSIPPSLIACASSPSHIQRLISSIPLPILYNLALTFPCTIGSTPSPLASSFKTLLKIFPLPLFGISLINLTPPLNRLCCATRSCTNCTSSLASSSEGEVDGTM